MKFKLISLPNQLSPREVTSQQTQPSTATQAQSHAHLLDYVKILTHNLIICIRGASEKIIKTRRHLRRPHPRSATKQRARVNLIQRNVLSSCDSRSIKSKVCVYARLNLNKHHVVRCRNNFVKASSIYTVVY